MNPMTNPLTAEGMVNCESCPKCGKLTVFTRVFNGWESFCPDCRIGAGMFNNWPTIKATEADFNARVEDFNKRLFAGEYLSLRNLHRNVREEVEIKLASAALKDTQEEETTNHE